MDIETWLGFIIFYVIPILWNVYESNKKKRNIFLALLFSFLMVTAIWLNFLGFMFYLFYSLEFIGELITPIKFIAIPIYLLGALFVVFAGTYIISPLFILHDTYQDKGKIKFDLSLGINFFKTIFFKLDKNF